MNKFSIYTDGGARGNPGPAAGGVVVCNEKGDAVKKYSKYFGDNVTNNEAEYGAVIFALEKFKAVFGKALAKTAEINIYTDSELLVKQINAEYKIENEKLVPLFIKLWNLRIDFKKVKVNYIPREKNKEADKLVNERLDEEENKITLFE